MKRMPVLGCRGHHDRVTRQYLRGTWSETVNNIGKQFECETAHAGDLLQSFRIGFTSVFFAFDGIVELVLFRGAEKFRAGDAEWSGNDHAERINAPRLLRALQAFGFEFEVAA